MASGPLYPLTFHPIFKQRVWGGRRLQELYGKQLPPEVPIGESWEISDRPGDISIVANGALAGKNLHWLVRNFPTDLLGRAAQNQDRFPLLIKILDARETLSLQVHPPATKAAELGGEPKTEMWFIAEAAPDAELLVGLRGGCTRQEFAEKMQQGRVADCFHRVRVRAGDAMFLPSGRVHALGAGLVIFEIQQNSDTTYRVFDWHRKGLDGQPRELHFRESLESIDFEDFEPGLLRPEVRGGSVELSKLVRDPLFDVDLARINPGQRLQLTSNRVHCVGVVSGELLIQSPRDQLALSGGGFCLVPASESEVFLEARSCCTCLCVQAGTPVAS